MQDDRLLEWAQANRARREPAQRMGVGVARLMGQLVDGLGTAAAVAVSVNDLVDDEFRRHCRVGSVNGRTLIIKVDDPTLVYLMRARWSLPLRRALAGSGAARNPSADRGSSAGRIDRVVFEFGADGNSCRQARRE